MDLSKLPKMGAEKTADAQPSEPPLAKPVEPSAAIPPDPAISNGANASPPVMMGDLFGELIIAGILGLIFIMFGANFGSWLIGKITGHPFSTNVNWTAGPLTGQPVAYFELQGGTAWLEMGLWVLGVCLVLEALLVALGLVKRSFGRGLMTLCLLLGLIGALANIVAIVMQVQAGFTQPIFSLVALAVGALTSLIHGRRLLT